MPSLSALRETPPGFGVWLVGHDWRQNVISSNSSAGETGETVSETVVPDPAPRPVRRSFTATYRDDRRGVRGGPSWEKGAVLRREGLYHSHIKEWTAARDAGARARVGDGRKSAPVSTPGVDSRLRQRKVQPGRACIPDDLQLGNRLRAPVVAVIRLLRRSPGRAVCRSSCGTSSRESRTKGDAAKRLANRGACGDDSPCQRLAA